MDDLSPREAEVLREWTGMVIDAAVSGGYVEPPALFTERAVGFLFKLYLLGLTPADAAQAVYATRH